MHTDSFSQSGKAGWHHLRLNANKTRVNCLVEGNPVWLDRDSPPVSPGPACCTAAIHSRFFCTFQRLFLHVVTSSIVARAGSSGLSTMERGLVKSMQTVGRSPTAPNALPSCVLIAPSCSCQQLRMYMSSSACCEMDWLGTVLTQTSMVQQSHVNVCLPCCQACTVPG